MRNPKPCKACKLHRKRCAWSCSNTRTCERCSSLDIECIQSDECSELLDEGIDFKAQDGYEEVQTWSHDVDRLHSDLLELQSKKDDLERFMSMARMQQQQEQRLQQTKQQQQPEWQLSIVNGFLQLETPIQTIQELNQFTQASIQYLSPFAGLFKQEPLCFDSTSVSTALGLGVLLQRTLISRPRKKPFSMIDYSNTDTNSTHGSAAPPAFLDYRAIMEYIIPPYLEHYNTVLGLVHAPTFLKHYRSLDNPLESLVVLAVCIDALSSCPHIVTYTAMQRRIIIEDLYNKYKELLFELYEDPTRKLEVIISTSLVEGYLTDTLLRPFESRRLVYVAILICAELEKEEHEMDRVERVLFQRHHAYLEMCTRAFDMFFDDKVNFSVPEKMRVLEVLDDEPEKTKQFTRLYNHIFALIGAPYISTIMGKVNTIMYGQPCELLLEDVLQYEPYVLDWWKSLPDEMRICEDPFDPMAYKLVEKKLPPLQLFPFIALHLLTGVLTSSILQPRVVPSSINAISENVIQAVRERLKTFALNASNVLIHSLKANWDISSCDAPTFSFSIIATALYSLERLGHCTDIPFPLDLLLMMKGDFNNKRILLLPDQEVPSSSSVVASFLQNPDPSLVDLYEQYPLPGLAMLSDILMTSFTQLEQQHLNATT
ncbi:hypothetical protein BDB00DRAFT_799640 [Zychaea mexicana]|uniref:uncharacterized protein n=1 Tax=Zychaea mexicana TaxID=64656 RepID=UPI0022FE4623|nr:uncharacterized protein BDB00DRAFT_799640 [Zychaea mexicana]KAI9498819.1 hypothetical protein BDB00DRAFT_799640 [Zychaea mexicana]